MIEKPRLLKNARSQTVFVLVVALIAVYLMLREPFQLGLDLRGGTQLIYEVDFDVAIARKELPADVDRDAVMNEMVSIIGERLDPEGITEAVVTRRGDQQILIELPEMADDEAAAVEKRISTLGLLEFRVVATPDYREGEVSFESLGEERTRLQQWLDANGGEMRRLLAREPGEISRFNVLPAEQGGPMTRFIRWYPHKIRRAYKAPENFGYRLSAMPGEFVVPVFDEAQYAAGPDALLQQIRAEIEEHNRTQRDRIDPATAEERVFLVEYVPINMHERSFRGEDLEAAAVRATRDENGRPAVGYEFNSETKEAYADVSDKYRDKKSAIILNNEVVSAPTFITRIYGPGIITGEFTDKEVADLVKVLKTGSLQIRPNRVSKVAIGAQLGAESVRLGMISIAVGSTVVMMFIGFYYRLSGIVAFIGLALNVFFILGIMQFIRATFTLPGLAGIVLTIGMAVDANILIYERIREEVKRGKALLQAVTAGFDRAMITILDSNITTFLAGLVLYNIGVGPIRGFAVTLMIGIVTTVFTAFFVCRLVFHYLLEFGWMREFRAADWFSGMRVNYLRYAKVALAGSLVVILGGAIYVFAAVDKERMLGLDFTGGANLRVVLREPTPMDVVRDSLLAHPGFGRDFPNPQLNTSGRVVDGKATEFGLKLKLSGERLDEYNDARRRAELEGVPYVPPYVGMIREALGDKLVPEAYDQFGLIDSDSATTKTAVITLHFRSPVEIAALRDRLARDLPKLDVQAVPDEKSPHSADVFIGYDTTSARTADQVFLEVREAIGDDFTDVAGNPVALSQPVPEAEEIGGRMVGELANAAIAALLLSWFIMVMYVRLRFHEYRYGIAAVVALVHDVLIALIAVVVANSVGLVNAEIDLAMIAAFLTIIGYSVNDTIVIFDRIRENISDARRLGTTRIPFLELVNTSLNQTMSRTILTTGATLTVVVSQFLINRGSGSSLEGFSFALFVGMVSGTYSTIFIAPLVLWYMGEAAPPEPTAAETRAQPASPVIV